jgi:hypothetical protein
MSEGLIGVIVGGIIGVIGTLLGTIFNHYLDTKREESRLAREEQKRRRAEILKPARRTLKPWKEEIMGEAPGDLPMLPEEEVALLRASIASIHQEIEDLAKIIPDDLKSQAAASLAVASVRLEDIRASIERHEDLAAGAGLGDRFEAPEANAGRRPNPLIEGIEAIRALERNEYLTAGGRLDDRVEAAQADEERSIKVVTEGLEDIGASIKSIYDLIAGASPDDLEAEARPEEIEANNHQFPNNRL